MRHGCTRSQAYSLLMVNACNVTVPYQTAPSLVVERAFLSCAPWVQFLKIWDESNHGSLCKIHVLSKKRKEKCWASIVLPQPYRFIRDVQQKTAITFQFAVLSSCVIFLWPTTRPTWTANCVSGAEPASVCQARAQPSAGGRFYFLFLFVFHVKRTLPGKDGVSFYPLWPRTHKHTRLEVGRVSTVKNTNGKVSWFSFFFADFWLRENITQSKLIIKLCRDEFCFVCHNAEYTIYTTCYRTSNIVIAHEMSMTKKPIRFKALWLDSGDISISRRNSCHVIVWLISCVIKPVNIVLYKVSGKWLS